LTSKPRARSWPRLRSGGGAGRPLAARRRLALPRRGAWVHGTRARARSTARAARPAAFRA